MFFKQDLSLIMSLRCPHDILSGPGVDESLQLVIAQENSSSEKLSHSMGEKDSHLFKINSSMLWN